MTFPAITALSNFTASPVRFMGHRNKQEAILPDKSAVLSELRKLNEEYELKPTTLFVLA